MTAQRKRVLYVLLLFFIFSNVVFRFLVFLITQNGQRPIPDAGTLATMHPICYTMAAIGLLAAIGWTLRVTSVSPTWLRFQSNVLLGLALSEFCSISGLLLFLMGAQPNEFNAFAIATVAIDILVILPQILKRV